MPLDPVRIDEIGVANCGWNVREPGSTVGSCYRDEQRGGLGAEHLLALEL